MINLRVYKTQTRIKLGSILIHELRWYALTLTIELHMGPSLTVPMLMNGWSSEKIAYVHVRTHTQLYTKNNENFP